MRFVPKALCVAILCLVGMGCARDPTASDEYQAIEQELAATQTQLEALTAEFEGATAERTQLGKAIDLSGLAAAWSSGDPDQIRSFYTDDAMIFPIGVDEVADGTIESGWGMGEDIDREAAQHFGGTYEIFDAIRVRDTAMYTWRWDLSGFIISGADILQYRDDLIWRHYIAYQAGD